MFSFFSVHKCAIRTTSCDGGRSRIFVDLILEHHKIPVVYPRLCQPLWAQETCTSSSLLMDTHLAPLGSHLTLATPHPDSLSAQPVPPGLGTSIGVFEHPSSPFICRVSLYKVSFHLGFDPAFRSTPCVLEHSVSGCLSDKDQYSPSSVP